MTGKAGPLALAAALGALACYGATKGIGGRGSDGGVIASAERAIVTPAQAEPAAARGWQDPVRAPVAAPARAAAAPPDQVAAIPEDAPATRAAPEADAPAKPARAAFVGTWGPTEAACGRRARRRGFLPATITADGAKAGATICQFRDSRRAGDAWTMAAECRERGRRWTSQVRLVIDGNRLTWSSAKGDAAYVRCSSRDG